MKQESPWANLKGQICLGDEAFLKRMERLAQGKPYGQCTAGTHTPGTPDRRDSDASSAIGLRN